MSVNWVICVVSGGKVLVMVMFSVKKSFTASNMFTCAF